MGGASLLEGRVEVFFLGHWGTVCSNYYSYTWDLADATVVCRQLGYLRAVGAPRSAAFGVGSGLSWYNNVQCTGTEMNLTECNKSFSLHGAACSLTQYAVAVCTSEFYYACSVL